METAEAEMDILSSATEDSMNSASIRAQSQLQRLPRIPLGTTFALRPSLKKKLRLSIMFLMARAGTFISLGVTASKTTINHSTELTNAVSEVLKKTRPGWTLLRPKDETPLAKIAVNI